MAQTKAQLVVGLNVNASAPASALQIDASGNVNLDSNTLYVDATNNRVGVGTATPTATLDCNGSIRAISASPVIPSSGAGLEIYYASGTFNGTPSAYLLSYDRTGTVYKPINIDASEQVFRTSGSEKMRLTSTGLGIGTSSPGGNLTVTDASTYTLNVNANAGGAGALLSTVGGSASLALGTNSTERVRITAAGNVGIGSNAPSGRLDVETASDTYVNFSTTNNGSAAGICLLGNNNNEFFGYANNLRFATVTGKNAAGFNERMRLDSSGRLLVGTSTARSTSGFGSPRLQLVGDYQSSILLTENSDNTNSNGLVLSKIRGTSIVQNGDPLGYIQFTGYDGSIDRAGAWIHATVDGTPGAGDMPTRLVFSTTADGASSPTQRMQISNVGAIRIDNANYLYPGTDNAVGLGFTGQRWTSVWAANGAIQTSDKRAKTQVTNATLGTDFIKSLRPVSYKWIEGGKRDTGKRDENNNYIYESVPGERTHWGFIAQEVKQAVDAAGVDFGGWVLTDKDDPDSQQALRYDQFIAPLTKALQEALAEIDVLKAKVAALESA